MLMRALKTRLTPHRVLHSAEVQLPVRLGRTSLDDSFARPLDRQLRATGLGEVTGASAAPAQAGGAARGATLTLALVTLHPRALRTVGAMLEELDAPVGSSIRFTETGLRHVFGRSEGLALYLDMRDTNRDEEARLDVLEACTDALDGRGICQGSADLGDRQVFYFYGDDYRAMHAALSTVLRTDPRCRHAYATRLA